MKILTEKFCILATSPSWQSWLYNYNTGLYDSFLAKLRVSAGCNANREIMADVLRKIDRLNGEGDLFDFLSVYHPDVIQEDITTEQIRSDSESFDVHNVFEVYKPDIITYPHRIIFVGSPDDLRQQIKEFIADKIKHDFIIIDDRAYIEYLTKSDLKIVDQIPEKNWQITTYRKNMI